MTFLTLVLLALLLAAWKAPAWVEEIGSFALAVGVLSGLVGFYVAAADVGAAGIEHKQSIIWKALSVDVIVPIYGVIIYLASLIIRIIQKPKI